MKKTACVITTINGPDHGSIKEWVAYWAKRGGSVIVVPDKKTPDQEWINWMREAKGRLNVTPLLEGGTFDIGYLRPESTLVDGSWLPYNHYARKNLGYLAAKRLGFDYIFETDDDNYPIHDVEIAPFEAEVTATGQWFNPFAYFGRDDLVPRGMQPYHHAECAASRDAFLLMNAGCWSWQCNGTPDLWAVQHSFMHKDVEFSNAPTVGLSRNTWTCINSQHTLWPISSLGCMYLPVTCNPRATDIIRGWWALQWLRYYNRTVYFAGPGVYQERNEHDWAQDAAGEWELMTKARAGFGLQEYIDCGMCTNAELVYHGCWLEECAK